MTRVAYVLTFTLAVSACTSSNPNDRVTGQTEFISAPMAGTSGGNRNGVGDGTAGGAPGTPATNPGTTAITRTVEETDLYRLEGTRLYYLNGYRGLMVF